MQSISFSKNKVSTGNGLIVLFLIVSSLLLVAPPMLGHNVSAASTSSIGLTISAAPAVLPADGQTYSTIVLEFKNTTSGMPYLPQSDMTVQLFSSDPKTGTVPSSVTFPANTLFVNVPIATTTLPGNTTISAFTSGFSPASYTIKTQTVGGMPTGLKVFLGPSQIPPDESLSSGVIVQVVDVFGKPVILGSPLTVTLSSSDPSVGSVPSTITIPADESMGVTSFSPTYVAGQTVITASALNYASGSGVMTTVGTTPRRLVVTVGPSLLVAGSAEPATVSVQLQDASSDAPAVAPNPVSVVLTSNNTNVAYFPTLSAPVITIPAGSSYATVQLVAGSAAGTANITASAQGYMKGSAKVKSAFAAGGSPNELALYFAPNTLLPNNSPYPNAVIAALQYVDSSGNTYPAIATGPFTVYARSSNNASMQVAVQPSIIQAGSSYASFSISTTFLPGSAEITAQSVGLSSSTMNLTSFGSVPNALGIQIAPSLLLAGGETYNSVIVSLLNNGTGNPAKAPVNTIVSLSSTSSSLGQIESSVTIPAGQTYSIATFQTSGIPGSTAITASASGYTSATSNLTLVTPSATNLGLQTAPKVLIANGQTYQNVIVQLQDAKGNPEKTDLPVNVSLSTQGGAIATVPSTIAIPAGSTYATIPLSTGLIKGVMNITAYATGFLSATTSVNTTLLPLTVHILFSSSSIAPRSSANLTALVLNSGLPVSGVNIEWKANVGTISVVTNTTDVNGTATAVYHAGGASGTAYISVNASKPGYATLITTIPITIYKQSGSNGFFSITILAIPLWLLIIVPAAIAGPTGSFFFIRRRRAATEMPEEEPEE